MFNKNSEKLESFVGTNTHFKGDITTKGTLRIDGSLVGNIETDWLILGEKAHLKGDIKAKGIIVGGCIEGNIKADEIIEIRAKGQIIGEIITSKLSMAEGAIFDGHSSMHRKELSKQQSEILHIPLTEKKT